MIEKVLEGLLDVAGSFAHEVLVKDGKSLMPMWLYVTKERQFGIIPTPFGNDTEKHLAAHYVRARLKAEQAIAYSVIMEAWAAKSSEEELKSEHFVQPRHRPDRREIVIAFAAGQGQRRWRTWDIRRNHLDRITAMELADTKFEEGKVESWLLNILDAP